MLAHDATPHDRSQRRHGRVVRALDARRRRRPAQGRPSANVACGFYAGDAATLVTTCRGAVRHGVAIGPQVGYGDLAGFGRRFLDIEPDALYADVLYQIGALDGIARAVGGAVAYVKPHGALYNAVVDHTEQAAAVVAAVADDPSALPLLGLPGSVLLAAAERRGLPVVAEAFADRAYTGVTLTAFTTA